MRECRCWYKVAGNGTALAVQLVPETECCMRNSRGGLTSLTDQLSLFSVSALDEDEASSVSNPDESGGSVEPPVPSKKEEGDAWLGNL